MPPVWFFTLDIGGTARFWFNGLITISVLRVSLIIDKLKRKFNGNLVAIFRSCLQEDEGLILKNKCR